MPVYDLKCAACGNIMKDVFTKSWETIVSCSVCGHTTDRIPSRFFPDIFPNGGIHLEHVSSDGKTFHSKGEMKKYAQEHDLELGAL